MDIMSAAGLSHVYSVKDIPHGLSLSVMKKGMDTAENLAMKELQTMLPKQPGKGDFIDVYA